MPSPPLYIPLLFVLTTVLTLFIFYKATSKSITTIVVIVGWLALQSAVSLSGFYFVTDVLPPRFLLLPLPTFALIIILFATAKGRRFIDSLNIKTLTILHIVRIPVEIVLYLLAINKAIPEQMTFAGRNFDILSGITAPLIYYFCFAKDKVNTKLILVWNFVCLALLINIVANAVLAAPSPFQQFAFEQPNVAILHFPFVWLPCCVVPLVLFSHLVSIRQLTRK